MAKRKKTLNVAMIGRGFMCRCHSNGWTQVARFFDPPVMPVMHTLCDKFSEGLDDEAAKWGWQNTSTDWKKVIHNPEIDLIDIAVPNYLHAPMAIEALKAGKHVACEKPLAHTLSDARKMLAAAKKAKGKTFVWYSYRGVPAVATAYEMVKAGKIGKIRHVRGLFLQSWADESVPLAWRFDKKLAGSGSLGDLNAHIIDMTRFITGEEIVEITGAIGETFIKERKKMVGLVAGGIAEGLKKGKGKGRVTVDDASLFLARFSRGAVASFEAARQATGNLSRSGFEIDSTKGALRYYFERMAELDYFDATGDWQTRGWTTINCSHGGSHPYADAWWPDGHQIGYEHTFTNAAYSTLRLVAGKKPVVPVPDFADAYETQRVLEAVGIAASKKRAVKMSSVR